MSDFEVKPIEANGTNSYSNTISEQILSSSTGAILTSMIITPFDVVKTRLQVQERLGTHTSGVCCLATKSIHEECCFNEEKMFCCRLNKNMLNGTFDAFVKIPKQEGLSSLWSGLVPTMMISVPMNIMYFTMYDQFRQKLISSAIIPWNYIPIVSGISARNCHDRSILDMKGKFNNRLNMIFLNVKSGSFTGSAVLAVTMVGPVEFLRTKVQSEKIKYSVAFKALFDLVKHRGFISLWHGWVPTIYRDATFSALYWSIYEKLKKPHSDPKFLESFLYGAFSGTVSAILTSPFDVIKTLRQSELGEQKLISGTKSPSTWSLLCNLYKERGLKSLFAGIVPRILKIAPACAIMISSYEVGKLYFKEKKINYFKIG